MTEAQMQQTMAAVYTITLQNSYDNMELAILNNFVNGFGRVGVGTDAHTKARSMSLIRDDGLPHEGLADAVAREVDRRVADGTFI